MSPGDKEIVGYCRPPKSKQWKKGQSGNSGTKKKTKKLSRMIEEIFYEEIEIIEDGAKRRISVFEAILLQLWLKQSKGNRRAIRVLIKYEAFAKTKPEYVVLTEEDRKESAAAYARSLEEEVEVSDSWKGLTAKEAAEVYYAMLQEVD
jgi:uncharacterized protein YrzB (UPF0473 family)